MTGAPDSVAELLDAWRMVLGLSLEQVQGVFEPDEVIEDGEYQGLVGVTIVRAGERCPGSLYLADGRVVLMYVGRVERWPQVTPEALFDVLGEPDEQLRSRAGRGHTQYLYGAAGIAFSAADDEVDFVEVFPPVTTADYLAQVYEEPPPFIR
jgi:hypothetical protein